MAVLALVNSLVGYIRWAQYLGFKKKRFPIRNLKRVEDTKEGIFGRENFYRYLILAFDFIQNARPNSQFILLAHP